MSQSFIELLSSKPVVNPPKEIEVKIATKESDVKVEVVPSVATEADPKEVSVDTTQPVAEPVAEPALIVDKRSEGKIDRQAILAKLRGVKGIKQPLAAEEPKQTKPKKRRIRIVTAKAKPAAVTTTTAPAPVPTDKPTSVPTSVQEPPVAVTTKPKKPRQRHVKIIPAKQVKAADVIDQKVLPVPDKKVLVRAPAYYMDNRKIFTTFINQFFQGYREKIMAENAEAEAEAAKGEDYLLTRCAEGSSKDFALLTHQMVVRDYLNLYTPYRGLLLYHGLGSGKTCSSIAIAEGMKTSKQVVVMLPASLERNYMEELKKCGDPLYKKNQYWHFISLEGVQAPYSAYADVLQIPVDFIRRQKGVWMVDVQQQPNYDALSSEEQKSLEKQLNKMIDAKYKFIHYNGLRTEGWNRLTNDGATNYFDDKVVIIDEAHNFISRIVNKISKPDSLSMRMYEALLSAQNARIVLLTGTPIINYPNEIGVLFNILRGYIKVWAMPVTIKSGSKVTEVQMRNMLAKIPGADVVDFVSYKPSTGVLRVTKNPFGFVNVREGRGKSYKGVTTDAAGQIDDETFVRLLTRGLTDNKVEVNVGGIDVTRFKALPDTMDEFSEFFIKNLAKGELKNTALFKRRIIGLPSYFRSAQEQLMPQFDPAKDLKVIEIPMSDYQFGIYEAARKEERKMEKQNKRRKKVPRADELYKEAVSTYRIFSRLFCNYVFPEDLVKRPMPKEGKDAALSLKSNITGAEEDVVDAIPVEQRIANVDGRFTTEDESALDAQDKASADKFYEKRINDALRILAENASTYLTRDALETYSPKFLTMLDNITNPEHVGLNLVYSQFRTLEGIGIFSLVLEANGFARFKLKKNTLGIWELDLSPEDAAKPKYVLYTGTEDPEEKEILRNIYNSTWDLVPSTIAAKLRESAENNYMGEVIKVFMITASGAEGISLRNTRYVHIMEPYWHPVRIEQVIGRARRICSHKDLPADLRSVEVFIYLMTFTEAQSTDDSNIELRLKDVSKVDGNTPLTSDQALFEIANLKQEVNASILRQVKEAAFDCFLHSSAGSKEKLVCYSSGTNPPPSQFAYTPSITGEEKDTTRQMNVEKITWKAKEIVLQGKKYALRVDNGEVYDYDSYLQALKVPNYQPILVGKLEMEGSNFKFVPLEA